MKLLPITNDEEVGLVALRMLEISQQHYPGTMALLDEIAQDQRLSRRDLLDQGFVLGVGFALKQLGQGKIKEMNLG